MNELTNASPILRGAHRSRLLNSARVAAPANKARGLDRLVIALLFGLVGSALTAPFGAGAVMSRLQPEGPAPWSTMDLDSDDTIALASAR